MNGDNFGLNSDYDESLSDKDTSGEGPQPPSKVADLNKSWEAMYLVDQKTLKLLDLSIKNIPGWALAGGTSYTPPPPMPISYRYAIWDMNPGYETHPDYIEWRRLEDIAETGGALGVSNRFVGVGKRRHWFAPERDMFMFKNQWAYNAKFCPCRVHREINGEAAWYLGWDNAARRFHPDGRRHWGR